MTDELKPVRCGCGGEAVIRVYESLRLCKHTDYYVQCKECGIATLFTNTEAEAVTAWNKAMSGNVQECAKDARCNERTAKAKELERRSETSMSWEGICTKCGAYTNHEMNYCFLCGSRLEWDE